MHFRAREGSVRRIAARWRRISTGGEMEELISSIWWEILTLGWIGDLSGIEVATNGPAKDAARCKSIGQRLVLEWQLVDGWYWNKDSVGDREVPILEGECVGTVFQGANYCVEVVRVVGSRVPSFENSADVDEGKRATRLLFQIQGRR